MANWKEPKNDYKKEDQVVPEIFNTLAENERYLQEKKITTEQVQDAEVNSKQSATRENVGDKETVKGFFGKVRKWFADLKALAFKGTVGTADIDSSAVTSAKIASNAVTSAKIASNAVTTAKINAKAVTDEKINSVSASKVTGLHKVATSGSYNDLTDKPTIPSGGGGPATVVFNGNANHYDYDLGFKIKGGYRYAVELSNAVGEGIAIGEGEDTTLRVCIPGYCYAADSVMNLYILCFTTNYNGNANYEGGGTFYVEGSADIEDGRVSGNGYLSINGHSCPAIKRVIELGKVYDVDSNSKPDKTWQYLDVDAAYVYGDMSMKSVEVPVDGLKVGDTIRATAMSLKVNMDYTSESYFFNTGNILYGWVFDGSGWYQLQDEYDYGYMGEKELSSESPFVSECGLFDYETPNKLTIKISCKRNGYLTVEWSDQAGGYIEMMPLYNFQVLR